MSQTINPREVLSYLNELGYVNITAQQLKEFIKDLKKLIKYECRHEEIPTKTSSPNPSVDNYRNNNDTPEYYEKKVPKYDVFHALHAHNTVASKARMESKRGKQILVHITKARNLNKLHDHCVHIAKNNTKEKENHEESATSITEEIRTDLRQDIAETKGSETEISNVNFEPTSKDTMNSAPTKPKISKSSVSETEVSNVKNLRPTSKDSMNAAPTKKSKSSVIKVGSTKSINRCDPVALYHQYKEEWKKIKFPGQDHHSDLRWAVREKLLSGPPVQVPLRKSSSKRKI